jgi:uncharacterized small protein (DUF1192 family)
MKKIELDNINCLRSEVARSEAELKKAIEAKARKHSESELKKADEEIARIEKWKALEEARLAKYEAEAEEAEKLAEAGGEIVLAYVWLDEYGFQDGKVNRSIWDSLGEAEEVYYKIKNDNGSYIAAWIEVRGAGEFERIKKLRAEIEKLEAELKELGGDD